MPKISRRFKLSAPIFNLVFILLLLIFASLIVLKNSRKVAAVLRVGDRLERVDNKLSKPISKPFFEHELIPQPSDLLSAHSATLTRLANGDLLALWFAGSHEGKPDVKIWQSVYTKNHWQMATVAISPESLSKDLGEYAYKLGNPVVYTAQDGQLHLFVVSVTIGGWAGSRINHFVSNDNGKTWRFSKLLMLSPLFNFSTLVRTNPVPLTNGGFYLPVYNEFTMAYPELLQFDKKGNFIRQQRMNYNEDNLLQPAIVTLSANNAIIFLRNKALRNNILYVEKTSDSGVTWSAPIATNLSNHDSSLAVAQLTNKLLLMVHNIYQDHSANSGCGDRGCLVLALSNDGVNWHNVHYLEQDSRYEFSYPAISVNGDIIDILYTWKRKQIMHVRFNLAWLMEHAT